MLRHFRASLVMLVLMTVLLGIAYPLAMVGIAGAAFPREAAGSLIEKDGKVVGSSLIGQSFTGETYFHGRLSATTDTDPADSTKTVPAPYNADRPRQGGCRQARQGCPRRSGHHLGKRSRSAHLARGGRLAGGPRRQGAWLDRGAGEDAGGRKHRRPYVRAAGRTQGQRTAAQPRPRRVAQAVTMIRQHADRR
jgi:hypothetical protein